MCWNDFLHKNILVLLEPVHVYSHVEKAWPKRWLTQG